MAKLLTLLKRPHPLPLSRVRSYLAGERGEWIGGRLSMGNADGSAVGEALGSGGDLLPGGKAVQNLHAVADRGAGRYITAGGFPILEDKDIGVRAICCKGT